MKTIYGKEISDLTENEKRAFNYDLAIFMSLNIMDTMSEAEAVVVLLSGKVAQIERMMVVRQLFVGEKILGLTVPTTQKEFEAVEVKVEKTYYNFDNIMELIEPEYKAFKEANPDASILEFGKTLKFDLPKAPEELTEKTEEPAPAIPSDEGEQ